MSDRPRVLVVEDSPAMRQLLSITLRRCGADVTEAGDGLAALKLLAQTQYDLIFVDLNMPVMDGLKLIQRVRSDGAASSSTRICVVTTEGAEESEKQARNLGADDYLRKPVSRKAVEAALEAWRGLAK